MDKWTRTKLSEQDQTKTQRTRGSKTSVESSAVAAPETDSAKLEQSVPKGITKKPKAAGDQIRTAINAGRDGRTSLGRQKSSNVVVE
jgi:hypothetical protein